VQGRTQTKESFFMDEPLGGQGKDLLNYEPYAKAVAQRLEASWFESAFAIGITGPWGSGKTSFMDLIKRHLRAEGKIIIDFNAWNSLTPEAISQNFFEAFREALSSHHSGLSRQL